MSPRLANRCKAVWPALFLALRFNSLIYWLNIGIAEEMINKLTLCFKCSTPIRGALYRAECRTVLPVGSSTVVKRSGDASNSARITLNDKIGIW